ncbi:MAG TPA: hypothetical protein PKA00_05440 [Saprospiraceae bacterium]|nr:hypothetical protein [Saprospiraceae bacterium]HMQ82326.1 hypothetical protein [Saprospiraceae bacterium]
MSKKNTHAGQVFHFDLYGKREEKYAFLNNNTIASIPWTELKPDAPDFFFVKKDFGDRQKYELGYKLDSLFNNNSIGITTERDGLCLHIKEDTLKKVLADFQTKAPEEIRKIYDERPDGRDWKMITAKHDVVSGKGIICTINYRPFDSRNTYYSGNSKGFMSYPRHEISQHLLHENIALVTCRQQSSFDFQHIFVSVEPSEGNSISIQTKERSYVFPLYLYPKANPQTTLTPTTRTPNFNPVIVQQIADKIGLRFTHEKEAEAGTFAPIDLLDYIYAVLHSPTYRETYKEFLKIDFPRVPYPKDAATFWALVALGGELRQLHLLESPTVEKYLTQYPADGDNVVGKIKYENGNVYINEAQYFANVPPIAWEFYIGGYQPAQKWLKDRKGRELGFEDILHYQKIIVALVETDRVMREIDKIGVI